ncbi:MAG TPA: GFA family protein [Acetobacteraceae bacterium]|nr:GFA family protein [Acetobacteraceae bacterium]
MLTGGCLCGAVRYEAGGTPFHAVLCHCSMCRRAAGAPAVAWFSVNRPDFRFTAGQPAAYRSTEHAIRRFCGGCGTQLTFESDEHPAEIDITTASLDDPENVPPADHVHDGTRLSWMRISDGLPRHPDARSEGESQRPPVGRDGAVCSEPNQTAHVHTTQAHESA